MIYEVKFPVIQEKTVYINGQNRMDMLCRIRPHIGEVAFASLKIIEIDNLPDGENLVNPENA